VADHAQREIVTLTLVEVALVTDVHWTSFPVQRSFEPQSGAKSRVSAIDEMREANV
jgi:hypothetical protein